MKKKNNTDNYNHPIIVFDIGGTWFRSGIYGEKNTLIKVSKKQAKNFKNTKYKSIKELQYKLIIFIKKEIYKFKKLFPHKKFKRVAISMGAALNSHNGFIYNSGPLWGPECKPFDMKSELKKAFPKYSFTIINDVSAAIMREAKQKKINKCSKILLITISTGIACRILDVRNNVIPVDKNFGLQGEIGHIPIEFYYEHKKINNLCDCGGINHLNAFCSGRGLIQLLKYISNKFYKNKSLFGLNDEELFNNFVNLIKNKNKQANQILDAIILPITNILLIAFNLDPLIDRVILTGGVVHALNPYYINNLLKQLRKKGMYQISNKDFEFFKKRIFIGEEDDNSGLIGAAQFVKNENISQL